MTGSEGWWQHKVEKDNVELFNADTSCALVCMKGSAEVQEARRVVQRKGMHARFFEGYGGCGELDQFTTQQRE